MVGCGRVEGRAAGMWVRKDDIQCYDVTLY